MRLLPFVVLGFVVSFFTLMPLKAQEDTHSFTVRLTFYTDAEMPMYTGFRVFQGAAAIEDGGCGRKLRHGMIFRVEGDPTFRIALDAGALVSGCHVDLYLPSEDAGWQFLARYGDYARVVVVQEPN